MLVVGMGNSGVDIAVEASHVAEKVESVQLLLRRGGRIVVLLTVSC